MPEFKTLTEQLLEKQSIYVLREIGRQIGVRSPSSKPRRDLINNIINIQRGVAKPIATETRGAPARKVDISAFYATKPDPNDPLNIPYDNLGKPFDSGIVFKQEEFKVEGVFEQNPAKYGFLRTKNYDLSSEDIYVSISEVKKYSLKKGDYIEGYAKAVRESSCPALQTVKKLNGKPYEEKERVDFDSLTAYYPTEKIRLENDESDISVRLVDIFAPIGFGQRALIVAPPKTGKTTLLKSIAKSIEKNYPEVKVIMLLIDERPEEVTDIKRSVKAEVAYSTFDREADHHVRVADIIINRAKRLVEDGQNVVLLMDSITKLTRAYNTVTESSGRILSGGIDPLALTAPKKFFGSARNIENGGSLTIISTALIETGSRMDDVIYEEFKGTGNMEIRLSRELSEKRVFPAIDINKSGTRKEELLLTDKELRFARKIRKETYGNHDATELIIEKFEKSASNKELLEKF